MKLTTGILAITIATTACGVLAAKSVAQNTDAIDNARSVAKSLQQKQANDSNAALDAAGVGQSAKPAPGAPAPAVKPAVIPVSHPAAPAPAAKPVPSAQTSSAQTSSASAQNNQLKKVNVVPGSGSIQIELSSTQAVTPRVSKMNSPARIVIELPGTVMATSKNHIDVGDGGVKGVRIGMNGKTPPTTSVVIDLDKALAYDMSPAEDGKFVLTLQTSGEAAASAKPAPASSAKAAPAKAVPLKAAPAPETVAKVSAPAAKAPSAKAASTKTAAAPKAVPVVAAKAAPVPVAVPLSAAPAAATAADAKPQPKPEDKKWAMNGKRDPFFSPVVQQPAGSGCSTGKKCLEIGNINLRGVVKSDNGFIAVVTNSLNKAYFLRENDPVFNGYVVKITGDSVVFQETVEDKLGKPFTREVVKRIFTPAV
jgi:Tfp pilus assembly protein PilP